MLIDIDEFYDYKKIYKDLPESLEDYVNRVKTMQNRNKKSWKRNTNNNNWLMRHKMNQDDDDKLIASFKGILNKIGDNNFEEISNELLQLEIDSEENLQKLVDMLFTKILREDKYSAVYIKLCALMFSRYIVDDKNEKVYFRKLLLHRCQTGFTDLLKTESENDLKKIDMRSKHDVMGLLKLIGGLYNNNLITNSIACGCLVTLVNKVSEGRWYAIDSLCTLMACIQDTLKVSCSSEYEKIIEFLKNLTKDKNIKAKDRFAIMDVLGL